MSTTKEVKEIVKKGSACQIKGTQTEKFIKASEKFDDLVRRGLVKRRTYQLIGVDNAHNARVLINTRH
jgi:hypothetical protein